MAPNFVCFPVIVSKVKREMIQADVGVLENQCFVIFFEYQIYFARLFVTGAFKLCFVYTGEQSTEN